MSTVFLVELLTAARISKWVTTATAGVYTRTLSADLLHVEGVTQDGTALTAVATDALVDSTAGSYRHDAATRVLRIHTTDGVSPASKVMVVTVLEPVCYGRPGFVITRNSVETYYDGRVDELPSIEQAISTDEPGAAAVAAAGTLSLRNEDGRYDRLAAERAFDGQTLSIYRGDTADAYSAFTLWLRTIQGAPQFGPTTCTIPLTSLARKLDKPIQTTTFDTTTYPGLDTSIVGYNIPKVWGPVVDAEAFRIASGSWKVSSLAMTAISACRKLDGTTVAITGTDLTNGTFTVDAANDTEQRLYVDGTGTDVSLPGEVIQSVVTDAGLSTSEIDYDTLAAVDGQRAVNLGFQVRTGSVRDVLDLIAKSAFVDWFVTRSGKLGARVRKADQGNLVANPSFETDATGWSGVNNAVVARSTSQSFLGSASGTVQKLAPDALAHAMTQCGSVESGARVIATCVAAVTSGSTALFTLGLTDGDGTEYLSDPVTLASGTWTRVRFTTRALVQAIVAWDATNFFFDDEATTFDIAGGELRVYPEYNGAGAVTVAIDDVQVCQAVVLDDVNSRPLPQPDGEQLVLWRVRARYAHGLRKTESGTYATDSDTGTQRLYPTAQSRTLDGELQASTDANTVASAVLTYYSAARIRLARELLDVTATIDVGTVIDLQTTRRPSVPAGSHLYRVVRFVEQQKRGDIPVVVIEAETAYDPIYDAATITAT